ncbi:MAG: TetR-like C-terminal domain-containing protein [Candidatus Sulfotelmatobacter sp.]
MSFLHGCWERCQGQPSAEPDKFPLLCSTRRPSTSTVLPQVVSPSAFGRAKTGPAKQPEICGCIGPANGTRSRPENVARDSHLLGSVCPVWSGTFAPLILQELHDQHISHIRAATIADVERGKAAGEFEADTDPELLIDSIIGPIYYRLRLRCAPLTEQFADDLIARVLRRARS